MHTYNHTCVNNSLSLSLSLYMYAYIYIYIYIRVSPDLALTAHSSPSFGS